MTPTEIVRKGGILFQINNTICPPLVSDAIENDTTVVKRTTGAYHSTLSSSSSLLSLLVLLVRYVQLLRSVTDHHHLRHRKTSR